MSLLAHWRAVAAALPVARRDGERIYHLPFDQRYDATLIEPHRGELWAATCAEAEERGFRRAWRWRAQDQAKS